jgi:hypothetical protein
MNRSHGLRGIHQLPPGRWRAQVRINNCKQNLGSFGTKEEVAAAYDSAARLNHVNAVCNYDSGAPAAAPAPARLPVQEVVAAAQPVRAPAAAAAPPSTTATTFARLNIAAPGDRWGGGG